MAVPVQGFLNMLMKANHSSTALSFRSGKALALMKPDIIHNDHAFSLETWNKCELTPVIKYMAVDILFKIVQRKQHLFIQSTDNISTS